MEHYFSADVETDGPVPGPYSMLSFALVHAGSYDGVRFYKGEPQSVALYKELKPISENFQIEALQVNGLNRDWLVTHGEKPEMAMSDAAEWVRKVSYGGTPVLVAYPVSFDWTWLYWYFSMFSAYGSPFGHSQCYDIKTAYAVASRSMISRSSRSKLPYHLLPKRPHTHHALDDAREQAEIFQNIFLWNLNVAY